MTQTAILAAIIIVMSITPLGYLSVGIIEITFLMIPIAVGGIVLGPVASTVLGLVFGLTSLVQAFQQGGFNMILMQFNPIGFILTLVVARVLAGAGCGLVYKGMSKICKKQTVNMAVASFSASAFNSAFYLSMLLLFFGSIPDYGAEIWAMFTFALAVNATVEAVACTVIGTAVSAALNKAMKR